MARQRRTKIRKVGNSTRMREHEEMPMITKRIAFAHIDQLDRKSRIPAAYTASEMLDRVKSSTSSVGTEIGIPIDSSP